MYIGRPQKTGPYIKLDDISSQFNGVDASFSLTSGGTPFYADNPYTVTVSLNGVVQEPFSAYTIVGDQITFASPPPSSSEFFAVVLGTTFNVSHATSLAPGISITVGSISSGDITSSGTVTANSFSGITTSMISDYGNGLSGGGGSYTDSDVDTHLNTGTASSGEVLSWNGSDYDWITQSGGSGADGYWEKTNAGINTLSSVGIGTTNPQHSLDVVGDARITGILTVGSSSLTLDGDSNVVKVGTALTLGHTQGIQFHTQNLHSEGFDVNNINASGIVTAGTFSGSGSGLFDVGDALNGIGTAVPSTDSDFFYSGPLVIDSVKTVDVPDGALNLAYVRHTDIIVESSGELIVSDGDELIPDVLDLASPAVVNQIVVPDAPEFSLSIENSGSVVGTGITSINFNTDLDVSVSGNTATVNSTFTATPSVSQATAVALSIALG
tara:strand:+ start:3956 stop:5275 length:1320 start_codon:yes stop_codon:yes gene_type:complete